MRYKKSILPNELNRVYYPNQSFSITLPRKKLDLNSFTLHYSGNPAVKSHIISFNFTGTVLTVPTVLGTAEAPVPAVNDGENEITIQAHGLGAEDTVVDVIYYANNNAVIAPLVDRRRYSLKVVDDDTVQVLNPLSSDEYDDTPINLTSAGAGTQYFYVLEHNFETIPRHFPRLSSCVLSDVIVSVGNKVVQHLREYNTLAFILNDINKEFDDIDSTTSDSVKSLELANTGYLDMLSKVLPYTRDIHDLSRYHDRNKQQFFVSKWLGFLGESSRYFDATDKEVKITFRLAPPNILFRGIIPELVDVVEHTYSFADLRKYTFAPDYEIYDIKATVDVLDDIPAIDTFVFRDYTLQQGSYLASNKKCTLSLSLDKPVEWVLGTFKQPDYISSDDSLQLMHCNDQTGKFGEKMKHILTIDDINSRRPKDLAFSYEISRLWKDPYVLNSSLWFSHQGDGILFTKYRWNGYDLTPQMDMTMCYNETKRCFNTDYKRVPSIQSFEADFFANAVRVDDNTNEYKQIEWEVEVNQNASNTKGGYPLLFCCYTNKL